MELVRPPNTAPRGEARQVTVDMTPEEFEAFDSNGITFVVNNLTPFNLEADPTTFAEWGSFSSGPVTVTPNSIDGQGGQLASANSPFTGSAGMVSYTIRAPDGSRFELVLLAGNPYLSGRDNWAYVDLREEHRPVDWSYYKFLCHIRTQGTRKVFQGKFLRITTSITQADAAIATFTISWN